MHLCMQELWRGDGFVECDGKVLRAADMGNYREGVSNRDRPRSRGGIEVRNKERVCLFFCDPNMSYIIVYFAAGSGWMEGVS